MHAETSHESINTLAVQSHLCVAPVPIGAMFLQKLAIIISTSWNTPSAQCNSGPVHFIASERATETIHTRQAQCQT